jgi:hypothetical protein
VSSKSIDAFHRASGAVVADQAERFVTGPSLRRRFRELDPFQWGDEIADRTAANARRSAGESRDAQSEPDYPFADND